jgi:hypothetical protein
MTFKVRTDVFKNLKKIGKLPYDKGLELAGQSVKESISDEADKGRGYKGSFRSYSKAYREYKVSEGRKPSPADLQFSGEMLRSILNSKQKAEKTSFGYKIQIRAPKRKHTKANITIEDLAEKQDARRPFFGVSRRYETTAQKVFVRFIEREYAKLQLD